MKLSTITVSAVTVVTVLMCDSTELTSVSRCGFRQFPTLKRVRSPFTRGSQLLTPVAEEVKPFEVCVCGGGGDTKLQIQNSSSTRVYPMMLVTTKIKKW